jgi:alkanesulfonate monooxygenase SsuD/methylene tetrahydromethanopterin reductase-like flavin-dependent oxidoreductase (luciferase family)
MQHGIILTAGDARTQVELAVAAEAAGWDGVFAWDAIAIGGTDVLDPWTLLAAIAARTERVRLGAMVFAPTRRRPWKLAKEAVTIDHLSDGRMVLPVGLGALDDGGFGAVGEVTGTRDRAARLDETLAILDALQSGEPVSFHGEHYRVDGLVTLPRPVQRPRIPVWVIGSWPSERSMRRAARWDGVIVQGAAADGSPGNHPAALAEAVAWLRLERETAGLRGPFDIVASGSAGPDGADELRAADAAGATWWVESDWTAGSVDALRDRVRAGPARSSA